MLLLPDCFSTAGAARGREVVVAVVAAEISKSSRHPGHLKGACPEKFNEEKFNILDLFLKKKKEKKKEKMKRKRKEILLRDIH